MINNTLIWTSIISAFFTVLALDFLRLFKFISWSPIGWSKKWQLLASAHFSIKWALLFVALTLIFALLYIVVSYTTSIPPSVTSILIGIVVVFAIEWTIATPKTPLSTIKSISLPFFAIMAIVLRFITGTAVFMKKLSEESMK
ncbi:hypothetical protein [Sporosarcina limicola]|uniref:Neutral ceramidase superfamily lipid hydrolase n=1 Tax=Sporosarcina limicola TaxID=34101 RepID=A0A927MFI2_9BACL|nr:hypothetical protein [Sporosarcina limicola]MBE1553774.1 putative neutral ceramidase superfamily lipid hydrolase [Sporosarcina limicola]